MSPNWWRSPCNRCHDICREKKNHPLSLCTLMDTAHQWHRSRRETPKRNDQGYWWDCIDGSCDVERLRGCHCWTSQKIWLYPWYLWPGLSSSHLQSSGAEGIQLLWLSILKRFEKFSRQWRQTVQTDPPKCKLCHETETLKMRFKMGCYELWCCYTSPKRWLDLSGWRKSKSSNLGFFSTFFSFRPAMFLVLYNFLANRAWHSKTSAMPGSRVPATKMPGNTGILGNSSRFRGNRKCPGKWNLALYRL